MKLLTLLLSTLGVQVSQTENTTNKQEAKEDMDNVHTVISCLSMHPFKYTPVLSAQSF
jgi:hypothetical protein